MLVVATLGSSLVAGCGGEVVTTEAALGECFQDPEDTSEVGALDKVDCDDAHDNEVISVFPLDEEDFPGEGAFPGDDAVEAEALQRCTEDFAEYVGTTLEESDLELLTISPTEETWEEGDDREVICAVSTADGSAIEGSVAGTAR